MNVTVEYAEEICLKGGDFFKHPIIHGLSYYLTEHEDSILLHVFDFSRSPVFLLDNADLMNIIPSYSMSFDDMEGAVEELNKQMNEDIRVLN